MLKFKLIKKHPIASSVLLAIILTVAIFWNWNFTPTEINWGVSFSEQYAKDELGLDWQKTYLAILDDLQVNRLRLSAYWNHNEPYPGQYNFSDMDWQINEATKRKVKIILGVGRRLPRWPECHDPGWIKNLTSAETNQRLLEFVTTVVNRYKNNPNIIYWQIENEPFVVVFGECPKPDKNLLKEEIKLVKSLSDKPIVITDSGELNTWTKASRIGGDILGTTIYRVVYNPKIGYWRWFLPPVFYKLKTIYVKIIFAVDKVIVTELQAEAWHKLNINLSQTTLEEDFQSMDLEQFKKNIKFAERAGFDESYLWGAEWWYFLKEKRNYGGLWEEAKKLWQ